VKNEENEVFLLWHVTPGGRGAGNVVNWFHRSCAQLNQLKELYLLAGIVGLWENVEEG
jgi:hypothetical protein